MVNNMGSTALFDYTPVETDADKYLRIVAMYRDEYYNTTLKTVMVVSENAVLAQAATNGAPTFTDGASATRSVAEDLAGNGNIGSPVSATDDDNDTLTYMLADDDASQFNLNTGTGQILLATNGTLDYEAKDSYSVRVQVRDSKDADGNADTAWESYINVNINVTNVEEAGAIGFDDDEPQVGVKLNAYLSDPDGSVSNLTWKWQKADNSLSLVWDDIDGAALGNYIPVAADSSKFLRVVASYDDGEGTGKEATGIVSYTVYRPPNNPPAV